MSVERNRTEDSIAEATSQREEAPAAAAGATLPQAPEIPAAPQQPSLVELQAQIEELRLDKANAEDQLRMQCSLIHRRLKSIENRSTRQYASLYRGIRSLDMLVRQLLPPHVRQQFPPLPPVDPDLERLTDEEENEDSEVDEDEGDVSEDYEDDDDEEEEEDEESEVDADVDDCSIEYEDKEFEASTDDNDDD